MTESLRETRGTLPPPARYWQTCRMPSNEALFYRQMGGALELLTQREGEAEYRFPDAATYDFIRKHFPDLLGVEAPLLNAERRSLDAARERFADRVATATETPEEATEAPTEAMTSGTEAPAVEAEATTSGTEAPAAPARRGFLGRALGAGLRATRNILIAGASVTTIAGIAGLTYAARLAWKSVSVAGQIGSEAWNGLKYGWEKPAPEYPYPDSWMPQRAVSWGWDALKRGASDGWNLIEKPKEDAPFLSKWSRQIARLPLGLLAAPTLAVAKGAYGFVSGVVSPLKAPVASLGRLVRPFTVLRYGLGGLLKGFGHVPKALYQALNWGPLGLLLPDIFDAAKPTSEAQVEESNTPPEVPAQNTNETLADEVAAGVATLAVVNAVKQNLRGGRRGFAALGGTIDELADLIEAGMTTFGFNPNSFVFRWVPNLLRTLHQLGGGDLAPSSPALRQPISTGARA